MAAITLLVALAIVIYAVQAGGSSTRQRANSATTRTPGTARQTPPAKRPNPSTESRGLQTIARLARLGLPIYCAGNHGNEVAFTFDDGPGPYTHYALKKLRQSGERATFFVVGRSINNFPGYLQRELPLATIGDHTYSHPLLTALSPDQVHSQISQTKALVERESGQPVTLFRPPYGARNSTVDNVARSLGLLDIIWSVDSRDSLGANYAGITRNVEAGLHPGAIILMHENRGQTIRALTTLLPELHRRHLRSVSLPELFATDPPSVAQVRRGGEGCGASVKPSRLSG